MAEDTAPGLTGIHHFSATVTDVEASAAWYQRVFGMARLPVVFRDPDNIQLIPGGRYATVRYTGHPAGLADATAALLAWADGQGLSWDVSEVEGGQRWGARLEIYESEPRD